VNVRLIIITVLAACTALWALPQTARGQMFVSVNSNPFTNGGSNVYQYDSSGNYTVFVSDLDHPRELAFDSFGNLYVATFTFRLDSDGNILDPPYDHGSILKVSGGVASTLATFQGATAHGLVIDNAGNVFASSQNSDGTQSTIYKVTFDGTAPDGKVSTFGSVPGQCFSLAFDSAGNLLAAGDDETLTYGTIYKFDPMTGVRSIFVDSPAFSSSGPIGMTFDNNFSHNLFVTTYHPNDGTGDIRSFDSNGMEHLPPLATGLTKNPRGLAFDSTDNLFCAEIGIPGTATTGDILKFDSNGVQTVFATQGFGTRGNRGPEYVAFAPPAGATAPPSSAVVLTFPNTTEPLITTTVEPVDQNSVPVPPANFELVTGGPSLAYEITAPADTPLTPPIIIGFTVPASLYGSTLKALHYENGNWVDRTIPSTDPNYPSNPAPYTIYASVDHLSPFLVAKKIGCQISTSVTSNFNGTPIKSGNYIWFNGVLKPSGLGSTPVTIRLTQQTITSANFTFSVPDATVTFDPTATSATTTFSNGKWVTRAPSSGLAGNTFFAALGYQVPSLPGGIKNVTWSATMNTDTPGVSVQWKWAAAVYTSFSSDYNAVGVKPVDDNKGSQYLNSDHAGTPENFKTKVTGGATGGGGSNYTGGYSGTASVGSCP
jgi:hypothetical protein